ncbi:MAG: hypothetical protein Q4A90_03845 [Streptococcus sp.]|nr:hypothetical protein [Streptococcus sp.]
MSVLKKILISIGIIVLLIVGLTVYNRYQASVGLKEAYRKEDRVKILSYLMTDRYEKMIEKVGFTIFLERDLKWDDVIEVIEVGEKISIKISHPNEGSKNFNVFFTVTVNGKETEISYVFDSKLNLTYKNYEQRNSQNIKENVTISEEEESRLLGIVQSELRDFFDKMEKSLYG